MTQIRSLRSRQAFTLRPTPPFHFDATFHKPDHFPTGDHLWAPGTRWQTVLWQGQPLGMKFADRGRVNRPEIRLSVWSEAGLSRHDLRSLVGEIEYRLDLQSRLSGFNRRFGSHPLMGPILKRWRGMRPLNHSSLYEYLIIAIVLQNTMIRRSVSMMRALFDRYGRLLEFDGRTLYCFWDPARLNRVPEPSLRRLKVGYRVKSIKRVSRAFAAGEIDEVSLRSQPREDQRRALLALYGIGPASVGYVLFDVFHHWDELKHISPWEQKIYSRLFLSTDPEAPAPVEDLLTWINAEFGEYRMLAVHYVWEDLFWRRKHEPVDWLEQLIRL